MSFNYALVVDDSKLARITLQRLLQKHNLEVDVAESGVAALEKIKSNKPDIIFMDHLMPELDGFEATQKIKADPATNHIPVIMCTGKEDTDNYDMEAKGIGASGTLSKPPQADQLALILAAAQSGEHLVANNTAGNAESGPDSDAIASNEVTANFASNAVASTESEELRKIIERISELEKVNQSLAQLDNLKERLTTSENSLTTLQESVISLKESSGEKALSPEVMVESVKNLLGSDIQQQFDGLKTQIPDLSSLKQDISNDLDSKLAQHLEATNHQTEPDNSIDDEALATRITEEVENTLKTLFEGRLSEVEKQVSTATDDAISEIRKDFDDQLLNSVSSIEEKINSETDNSVPDQQLSEELRSEIIGLASTSAKSALEGNIEDHLTTLKAQLQESLVARTQDESSSGEALPDNPEFLASIEAKVESRLSEKLSSNIKQELEKQVGESKSAIEDGSEHQDLQSILDRIGELDRRQDAIMDRLDTLTEKDGSSSADGSKTGSSGIAVGLIAIATAAAALLKSFGLF